MIKTRLNITVLIVLIIFGLFSCKTYYIPIDSFKEQVKDIDSVELRTVYTKGPMGDVVEYKTYPIDYIKCEDKNNHLIKLKNSPSIEIKFTDINNKKTIFYFDQIYIQDSIIIGGLSRFLNIKNSIPLNEIKKIEIQDGHKNFKYVDKRKK